MMTPAVSQAFSALALTAAQLNRPDFSIHLDFIGSCNAVHVFAYRGGFAAGNSFFKAAYTEPLNTWNTEADVVNEIKALEADLIKHSQEQESKV